MEENVVQIKSGITINVDVSVKNMKGEKYYIWNHTTCSCENGKYLYYGYIHYANIMDDSVITCDAIIEETRTIRTNFNEKKVTCKT